MVYCDVDRKEGRRPNSSLVVFRFVKIDGLKAILVYIYFLFSKGQREFVTIYIFCFQMSKIITLTQYRQK